jgi:hypothetical protein
MDTQQIAVIIDHLLVYIERLSECSTLLEILEEQISNPALEPEKLSTRIAVLSKEFCSSAECNIETIQVEIKRLYSLVEKVRGSGEDL